MDCLLTFLTFWKVGLKKTHIFFLLLQIEIQLFCLVRGGVEAKEQAEFAFTNI